MRASASNHIWLTFIACIVGAQIALAYVMWQTDADFPDMCEGLTKTECDRELARL